MKIMNKMLTLMNLMLMFLRNKTKLFNINNVYYVYCKHQCAIKIDVVYVVTYDMS